jgi:hypothetical protein
MNCYTGGMVSCVLQLAALLAVLGQVPFYGEIPENVPTFRITYPDGAVAHGALAVGGQWWMEDVVDLPQGTVPTIVFDTPWAPRQDRSIRVPQFAREMLPIRKQRLAEEWKAAGFEPAPGSSGMVYAPVEEIRLAQRAHGMEAQVLAEVEGALAPVPAAPQMTDAPVPAVAPGFADYARQWGPHVAVFVVGLMATAVIFKKMVLDAA